MPKNDAWRMPDSLLTARRNGLSWAAAIEAADMPILLTDPNLPDNPIVFVNDAFVAQTGYTRQEALSRNCRFLQGPSTDPAAVARLRDAVALGSTVTVDVLNYRKDGTEFWNRLSLCPLRDATARPVLFLAVQIHDAARAGAAVAPNPSPPEASEIERLQLALADAREEAAVLRATIDAKNLLIHEVDHRVKNNLQMISSLLSIQMRTIGEPAIRAVLDATRYRIEALGAVHKRLYQAEEVGLFDASEFVRELTRELLQSVGRPNIHLVLHIEPVELQAKQASAIALIVNELVMNALKHAFPDNSPGTIIVRMGLDGERLSLTVEDNGVGMARDKPRIASFGMTLVTALARQFMARMTWTDVNPGTRAGIEILPSEFAG